MPACAACTSSVLVPHLSVADARAEDLIPTTDRFGAALGDIGRCPACSHMQLDRFPTEAELGAAYGEAASEDYVEEEAGQRETARVALERIERFAGRGAILDLGCWVGFLLAVARERGWEATGVEPSEFASAYARERLGLDVIRDDLFEADLGGRSFRAVVMGDVIEHLPRPAGALDRMAALLEPGGVAYLALPNAGSRLARRMGARWWSVIPTHVQYFTRASLFTLLRRRGWEPLWAGTAPKAFTVRYYLERIGGYSPPAARALVGAASAAGVADRMWAPDFRDRLAVIARPPAR
ncbi:MAG TPA: class I SAM-dependent methyltransferase [Thermoleophilaceae bacterium]|jgi:SAM-dependent methyltransferase